MAVGTADWWAQVDFESRSAFTAYTFVEALGEPLVHATCARVARLVGSSGLEPPTSCLSGTRSNLLSYEPVSLLVSVRLHRFVPTVWLRGFPRPGGDEGNRTLDPLLAGQVLSQLSYTPVYIKGR